MAIDLFKTRTLLASMEIMKPAKSFLLDTFFKNTEQSDTKYVDIDVIRGKRRMAAFVRPTAQGKLVDRIGYSTNTYQPPYIKPKMVTTAADMFNREPGNTIYADNGSPASRAAKQLGKDMAELREMIVRREEWMAAQLLNTGAMAIVGEGVDDTIDFGMAAGHKVTLTGTALFTDAASDPIKSFRTWRRTILQDCGRTANVAILGSSVVDALMLNANFLKQLDTRRAEMGIIKVGDIQESGATYIGSLFAGGLDLYSYDAWYLDDAGNEQPYVPVDKIFLGATGARTARHYGAIQDLDANAAVPFFPKSWREKDPSVQMLLVQSAPLVAMHEVDAFMSIKAV